jgi:hypothetical protein
MPVGNLSPRGLAAVPLGSKGAGGCAFRPRGRDAEVTLEAGIEQKLEVGSAFLFWDSGKRVVGESLWAGDGGETGWEAVTRPSRGALQRRRC